jgi:hypothetical protein
VGGQRLHSALPDGVVPVDVVGDDLLVDQMLLCSRSAAGILYFRVQSGNAGKRIAAAILILENTRIQIVSGPKISARIVQTCVCLKMR